MHVRSPLKALLDSMASLPYLIQQMNIMAHPKSGSELSAGSGSPEAIGKHYFK